MNQRLFRPIKLVRAKKLCSVTIRSPWRSVAMSSAATMLEQMEASIPHAHEPVKSASVCQSMFFNLLRVADAPDCGWSPSVIFRELLQTVRCDKEHDLRPLRERYVDYFVASNKGDAAILDRIVSFETTARDEQIVRQAAIHYRLWTHREIMRGLNWPNMIYYYTIFKAEKTFVNLRTIGMTFAGDRRTPPM